MMNSNRMVRALAALPLLGGLVACDLDLTNPNAPAEQDVLANADLLLATTIGLQAQYADNVLAFVRAPALTTDEFGTRTRALAADISLVSGTPDPNFGVVTTPFEAAYRIARTADILAQNAGGVGLSPGLQAGVLATSRLFKAMALGNVALQYDRAPTGFDPAGARPQPRAVVLDTVIALLQQARTDLNAVASTDAGLVAFRSRALGTGIDLQNTIDAMIARYALVAGRHQLALEAAGRVNLGVLSVLAYPAPGVNPIYNYGFELLYVGTRKAFFTEARDGDRRPAYWANRASGALGFPADSVFDFARFGTRDASFPLYLPDEMRLIQAESNVRLGNLAAARTLVNAVRTQCASPVNEPLACQPALADAQLATADQILAEILYQRRYELYAQGLRMEDLRRLEAVAAGRRPSIRFLPYPQSECDRNPTLPCA